MIYWSVGFHHFSSYTFLLSIFFVFLDDSWLFVSSILDTLYVTKWGWEFVSILLRFQRTRRFFRQKIEPILSRNSIFLAFFKWLEGMMLRGVSYLLKINSVWRPKSTLEKDSKFLLLYFHNLPRNKLFDYVIRTILNSP